MTQFAEEQRVERNVYMRTESAMTLVREPHIARRDFTYVAANEQLISKAWRKNSASTLDGTELVVSQKGPAPFSINVFKNGGRRRY